MPTQPLALMLQEFVRDWNRSRPARGGQFTAGGVAQLTPIGAVSWLVEETRLPRRTIRRVLSEEVAVTELRVADALVRAIDRPQELSPLTGSLEIIPNPYAPATSRATCCGTQSLNGSL